MRFATLALVLLASCASNRYELTAPDPQGPGLSTRTYVESFVGSAKLSGDGLSAVVSTRMDRRTIPVLHFVRGRLGLLNRSDFMADGHVALAVQNQSSRTVEVALESASLTLVGPNGGLDAPQELAWSPGPVRPLEGIATGALAGGPRVEIPPGEAVVFNLGLAQLVVGSIELDTEVRLRVDERLRPPFEVRQARVWEDAEGQRWYPK